MTPEKPLSALVDEIDEAVSHVENTGREHGGLHIAAGTHLLIVNAWPRLRSALKEMDLLLEAAKYFEKELAASRKECEVLREGLSWYASAPTHEKSDEPGYVNEFGCGCCAGTLDADGICGHDSDVQGSRARAALERADRIRRGEGDK
jgi:hypothetical protein